MLVELLPILLLIVAVLGGIYGGFFNATDAGAVGAAGALVIALIKRRLDRRKLWQVMVETGHVTASVSFRSEAHTSELQSLMRSSSAVFCLTKNIPHTTIDKKTL